MQCKSTKKRAECKINELFFFSKTKCTCPGWTVFKISVKKMPKCLAGTKKVHTFAAA
jgi:hypothetical protein